MAHGNGSATGRERLDLPCPILVVQTSTMHKDEKEGREPRSVYAISYPFTTSV